MASKRDEDSLSEDDGVFNDSQEEENDNDDQSASNSEGVSSGEESEAQETDEEDRPKRRRKVEPKKKKKKPKRNRFIDTEADVGDDDDDEVDEVEGDDEDLEGDEEDEDEEDGFVDNEIEEREKAFNDAFQKRLAAHAARREAAQRAFEEDMSPEAVEARLKQLYGRQRHGDMASEDRAATEATISTVLQPQPSDPKLWLVKCRPGRERSAVSTFLRALSMLGNSHGVYSVIGKDSLKGFIYVEAHRANDVMNAVQKSKVNHLIFASPLNRPIMVPMAEMADVLSVGAMSGPAVGKGGSVDISTIVPGSWVRVKRGKYAGDLAQVVEVEEEVNGQNQDYIIRVKLLPRLSLRAAPTGKGDRPSPRPFDAQEASQYGSVTKVRGYWIFNGDAYKDGFLFKQVRASSLVLTEVEPRTDELERFGALSIQEDEEGTGHGRMAGDAPVTGLIKLSKGERVVVTRGEFQHMTGVVDSPPEGDLVSVKFDEGGESFSDPVKVPTRYLARRLEIGDSVRVAGGEHAGKSGLIVSIDEGNSKQAGKVATIFSSTDGQQLTVPFAFLVSSLAESDPPAVLASTIKGMRQREVDSFEIHDLVSLPEGQGEVGIITKIFSDERMVALVDLAGSSTKLSWRGLKKIPKPPASFGRTDPSIFKSGDRVQFTEANGEVRPATVLQVYRNTAFVVTIDRGEVVVKPFQTLSRPAALITNFGNATSMPSTPRSSGPIPRHMIGKSVTIMGAGPYKGYVGIVKDVNDSTARIELHTNSKVVTVGRERIMAPGNASEGSTPSSSSSYGRQQPSMGSRTPAWGMSGGKTPAWNDSKTPAWGGAQSGRTPAWGGNQSGKTPAWGGAQSGKTPAWGGAQSGKTPAWGGAQSGKTPAWGSSTAKTPAWGAKTPSHHQDGGKTPSWASTASSSGAGRQASLPPWIIQDAEVSIRSSSTLGRITSILPSGMVYLSDRSEPVAAADLVPVQPTKKDVVKLLNDDRASGTVVGLDGPDAVIRVDGTSDFRIVPISSLVKISRPS